MTEESPTLPEYWDMLNRHDWLYEYADDHRIWTKGNADYQQIKWVAKKSMAHKVLFDSFSKWAFKSPINTKKPSRPGS